MKVIVYTTPQCVVCERVIAYLEERKIPYETRNLDDTNVMADLIMRSRYILAAPVVEIDGKFFTTFGVDYMKALEVIKNEVDESTKET